MHDVFPYIPVSVAQYDLVIIVSFDLNCHFVKEQITSGVKYRVQQDKESILNSLQRHVYF